MTPLRGFLTLSSCPWVPRGLVTHGYCCFGATRLLQRTARLFPEDGIIRVEAIRTDAERAAVAGCLPAAKAGSLCSGGRCRRVSLQNHASHELRRAWLGLMHRIRLRQASQGVNPA